MTVTTDSGFTCTIDDDALDDMELLDDLIAIDRGETGRLSDVITRVIGADGKKALYEHIRNDAGRVTITATAKAFVEIMSAARKSKN